MHQLVLESSYNVKIYNMLFENANRFMQQCGLFIELLQYMSNAAWQVALAPVFKHDNMFVSIECIFKPVYISCFYGANVNLIS